ncbi:hypothetical protein D3C79_842580 [compost metagenome]
MRFYDGNPIPRHLRHFVVFDEIVCAIGPVGGKLVVPFAGDIETQRRIGIEIGGLVHIDMTGFQILNAPGIT